MDEARSCSLGMAIDYWRDRGNAPTPEKVVETAEAFYKFLCASRAERAFPYQAMKKLAYDKLD